MKGAVDAPGAPRLHSRREGHVNLNSSVTLVECYLRMAERCEARRQRCERKACETRAQLRRWESAFRTPLGWCAYWIGWPASQRVVQAITDLMLLYERHAVEWRNTALDARRKAQEASGEDWLGRLLGDLDEP